MSFLEDLEAIRERVLSDSRKELVVNGSRGKMWVRFKPPEDRDQLTRAIGMLAQVGALTGEQELQFIVDCCDEVLQLGADGELQPAYPDGEPLRFDGSDERWGKGVKTARDAVRKLYNLDVKPLALAGVVDVLVDWLQSIEVTVEDTVAGESDGTED